VVKLLLCKQSHCFGIWYTLVSSSKQRGDPAIQQAREPNMSKTISIALPQPTTVFGRLLAAIDRALTISAQIAVRNGDLPRFGL
jgi:hypothetical protein